MKTLLSGKKKLFSYMTQLMPEVSFLALFVNLALAYLLFNPQTTVV